MLPRKQISINFNKGFTIIELVAVVVVTATLATIVAVNFSRLRTTQQIQAAAAEMVSKIREIQNFILSGKVISGTQVANSYDLRLTSGNQNYTIDYIVRTSPTTTTTTTLETVNLPENTIIQQILVQGLPVSPIRLRFRSPFGRISVNGAVNQTVQINLFHQKTNLVKSVIIDAISGRIGVQ